MRPRVVCCDLPVERRFLLPADGLVRENDLKARIDGDVAPRPVLDKYIYGLSI